MKIAYITTSASRCSGGLLGSMQPLTRNLSYSGCSIDVLALEDVYSDADIDGWQPVTPLFFQLKGPPSYGYGKGMLEELSKINPSLIHTHGLWNYTSFATSTYCRKAGIPYLVSPHGMLDPWALANSRWKKKIAALFYENRHLNSATCIHSLCGAESIAIRNYGLANPICQIPNGIDLPGKDSIHLPPPWRGKIPDGKKVILYLGRIHPKKGISNLISAFSAMNPADRMEWSIVVAGWEQGGHESELKQQVNNAGLSDEILFIGPQFREAKVACYYHANAFILPSFSEGLPMVILEAWAHSLPVIMTPFCNLQDGYNVGAAIRIEPCVESIFNGLKSLFSLTDFERTIMGERGHILVKEKYAWPKVAAEMKCVYEWILWGGHPPECVRFD